MKKFIFGLVLGALLTTGVSLSAGEFGWTDTAKLGRVADGVEKILAELQGLRADLRARK
jgi:hypothetical protein